MKARVRVFFVVVLLSALLLVWAPRWKKNSSTERREKKGNMGIYTAIPVEVGRPRYGDFFGFFRQQPSSLAGLSDAGT